MPRRSGGGRASPSRGFSSRAPARPPAPMSPPRSPMPAQQPGALAQPQPKQPGLMAQMATTAAGVAVGSAVGHTIGHAMTGGGGSGQSEAAPAQMYPVDYQNQQQPQQQGGQCQMELQQFLNCAQNQSDLSLCSGFNEALRNCKVANGKPGKM